MKSLLRTSVTALAVLALLPIASLPAAAQQSPVRPAPTANADDPAAKPTPRLADGHPDLNGFWAIGRGPDTPVGSGFGQRNPNIKRAKPGTRRRNTRIRINLPTSPS
jgi:hypothetical protein